jgi:ubiquinone/menaquinone biosynthesis C-methylase UbiE
VAFAREAAADGDGWLLDAAGGSAVFTADVYRAAGRPVVLADLSLAMLARARSRLGDARDVTLVQADAADPPFAPGSFPTVACMSALHVFPDPAPVVHALWWPPVPLRPRARDRGRLGLPAAAAPGR